MSAGQLDALFVQHHGTVPEADHHLSLGRKNCSVRYLIKSFTTGKQAHALQGLHRHREHTTVPSHATAKCQDFCGVVLCVRSKSCYVSFGTNRGTEINHSRCSKPPIYDHLIKRLSGPHTTHLLPATRPSSFTQTRRSTQRRFGSGPVPMHPVTSRILHPCIVYTKTCQSTLDPQGNREKTGRSAWLCDC